MRSIKAYPVFVTLFEVIFQSNVNQRYSSLILMYLDVPLSYGHVFQGEKNKSGMVSIQILDERGGSCRKSKTSVSFADPEQITCLH